MTRRRPSGFGERLRPYLPVIVAVVVFAAVAGFALHGDVTAILVAAAVLSLLVAGGVQAALSHGSRAGRGKPTDSASEASVESRLLAGLEEIEGALFLVLDREGRIRRFGSGCQLFTGFAPDEVEGETLCERLIVPDEQARAQARLQLLGPSRPNDCFETRWTAAGGDTRHVALAAVRLGEAGDGDGRIICLGFDITALRAPAEPPEPAETLEAVAQLTGGIAHDFNNLLAVILIDLDLVLRRLDDDSQSARMVEHAVEAARKGAAMINRLLSFARQQPLQPETVTLDGLIRGWADEIARRVGADIRVDLRGSPDLWSCKLDPKMFEQALMNLVANARDAMPEGGSLLLETDNLHVGPSDPSRDGELPPGDYVRVSVTDTGSGIADDVRQRVFEPFFTTKAIGAGSGLGLSMVHGFVKQSGGTITVHSLDDWGSSFRLHFPRTEPAAEAGVAAATSLSTRPEPPAPKGFAEERETRILLVEDDDDLRGVTKALLESFGYQVVDSANGADALSVLEQDDRFDLLFTDLQLPGDLSGDELGRAAHGLIPALRVLYMSGMAIDGDRAASLGPERDRVLRKPFRRKDLQATLQDVMQREP